MPFEIDGRKYMSSQEVADAVDVSRQTIWRWRKSGKIPSGYRYRTGRLIFSMDELEAIRDYANRIQPSEAADSGQFSIFD